MARITTYLAALALALGVLASTVTTAEARHGRGVAAGVAAAIIGGIILHQLHKKKHRHYYRRHYYDDYYYKPYYYRHYYGRPYYRRHYYRRHW